MMKSGSRKTGKRRRWITTGGCVQGASHIRNGQPCQDALSIKSNKNYHVISVSDGHGSAQCPFSDDGAQAAVEVAYFVFDSIFKSKDPFNTFVVNKDIWIPKQIEQHWKNTVALLHGTRPVPFSYELYGATLLTLAITDDFVFALQLGDGDILAIEPVSTGNEMKNGQLQSGLLQKEEIQVDWIIPPEIRIGSETESLCQTDAWQYMKARIIPLGPEDTAPMFLLSTDGYANSFNSNEGFKKAGADFYNLWKEEGLSFIEDNLEGWLMESSAQGSGDDIAVALIKEAMEDE